MQYFAWGINKPGVKKQRAVLIRSHWDFIAKYNESLIARGPVISNDHLGNVTGSIHIVDLPNTAAVDTFVNEEPFAKAGLFEEIIVKRFRLDLGRSQFNFKRSDNFMTFFINCPASGNGREIDNGLVKAHNDYVDRFDRNMICHGTLLSLDEQWQGKVFFVEFSSRAEAINFLDEDPFFMAGLYSSNDIHNWTMGGPENLNAEGIPNFD